ncbi:MAG: sodium/solute symporter [Planctomycetota bacterium]
MHWIDTSVVLLYLAGTLVLGLLLARRVRSGHDFFLAGRRLPFWAIGMSLVVTDIGALEMVGGTGNAYRFGIAQANFEWIGCVPAMVIGGLLFVPIYWKLGIHSIPEFLGRTYGPAVRAVLGIVAVVFLGAALGIFFEASAVMFEGVLGWSRWTSIAVTAIVVAIYTSGGGLGAVVYTDVIQCVILFAGGLAIAGVAMAEVGGLGGLRDGLAALGDRTAHHLELLQPDELVDERGEPLGLPWTGVLVGLGIVLSPAYWLGNQAIVQRTLGARDVWHARASMLLGAALKIVVPVAFVVPGLLGVVLLADRPPAEANDVYPILVRELAPVGIRGLVYAAFLAALMSTVDSYANSAATVLVKDLYARFLVRGREDGHHLWVGRVGSLAIIAFGVAMVPVVARYGTIYEAFQSYLSFFQGPTLALILGAVLWRRASPAGGLACLAGGIGTAAVLHAAGGLHYLHVAWWSFVASVACLVLGSWRTRRGGREASA